MEENKKLLIKPIIVIIGIILLFLIITTTIFVSKTVIKAQYDAELLAKSAIISNQEIEIKQYHEQALKYLDAQYKIRAYVNELVELLYDRESSLGVGGAGDDIILNEQTPLFQLKQAIDNLQDDNEAMKMVRDYLVSRRQFAESFPFIWPVKTDGGVPRVSSKYGIRSNEEIGSILGDRMPGGIHFHAGIDIPGKKDDPIIATADGRVIWVNLNNPVYGKVIVIQHDYGFQTLYGHCDLVYVKMGQYVKRGQIIGGMGESGAAQGIHVHYEIKKDGYHIDPMKLLGINF